MSDGEYVPSTDEDSDPSSMDAVAAVGGVPGSAPTPGLQLLVLLLSLVVPRPIHLALLQLGSELLISVSFLPPANRTQPWLCTPLSLR